LLGLLINDWGDWTSLSQYSTPIIRKPFDPKLYKKLFGLLLLVVGLDMLSGFTDALRQRQEPHATRVARAVGVANPAHSASRS
jgi:hypothetical protein